MFSKYWAFLTPAVVYFSSYLYGQTHTTWTNVDFSIWSLAYVFIGLQFLDWLFIASKITLRKSSQPGGTLTEYLILLCSVPIQLLHIIFTAWFISTHTLSVSETVIFILNAAVISALYSHNPAHELVHRTSKFAQWIGITLFSMGLYSGAKLAHLNSHHVLVATDVDPNTASYDSTLYRFLGPAIAVNLFSWWGGSGTAKFNIYLKNIYGYLFSFVLATMLFYVFGTLALAVYLIQAFLSIVILEVTNYMAHYGLERKSGITGFETIKSNHSWDCDAPFSNLVLINLPLHADHHLHPYKTYGELVLSEGSPRLPLNYPVMVLCALIPPLWKLVIHPVFHKQKIMATV